MRLHTFNCVTALVAAGLALSACSGFSAVVDAAAMDGGRRDGGGANDARGDGPGGDVARVDSGPDLGGKLGVGACCGKQEDCATGLCLYLGQGPGYCAGSCSAAPDTCPVGFACSAGRCLPPSELYQCGPQVTQAKPQGLGGCCGKQEDCLSGLCRAVGSGAYFCSQTCTTSPDTCPIKYVCGSSKECAPTGAYSCSYN